MSYLLLSEVFPPRPGGSGRWFWEIYRRLPREEVAVMAGEHPLQEAFDRTHDLRIFREAMALPSWGVLRPTSFHAYRRLIGRVHRLVVAESLGEIHAGKCLPEGLIGLTMRGLAGVPYLCYVHGEELGVAATSRELSALTRAVLKGARRVVANSQNTAWMLRENWGIVGECLVVHHPGVDTTRFRPARCCEAARARLGWQGRTVILTVGRLDRRKGHDRMIEALAEVGRSHPDVLYSIAGDGDERGRLEEIAARLDLVEQVQFLGACDDARLIEAYQQCDLFALPNRAVGGDIEGFGMVLLEAQACGRPVLAGDSGGTAETLLPYQTGRIVDCRESSTLAYAVLDLLSDPVRLERMGQAARRWAVSRFDWSSRVAEWHRLVAPGSRAELAATCS